MLKGAYSEKFKIIHQEQLDKLKDERKEFVKEKSDRAKELSKETNRRRKAIEERKQEQQDNEEKVRKEVLAKRKQEQQEVTQRFQKDTLQRKTLIQQDNAKHATEKEPIPVRNGLYVVRNHTIEIKNGKQVPHFATAPNQLAPQEQAAQKTWRDQMPGNYNFQNPYHGPTDSGFLFSMSDSRNEGKLYSVHPAFDPYGSRASAVQYDACVVVGGMGEITDNAPIADTLNVAEQEKLRADAIARSGPKLAFISDELQKGAPEGALPCIMGRESPGGSVTSLDSLDEFPGRGKESDQFVNGIMAKGGRDNAKSAGKRRVTFSDSIEFDDGVTGQLVTEEKQSTKVYTMLYSRNLNNHYKTPSSGSVSASAQPGVNQKGNQFAGIPSVKQTGTEQVGISTSHSHTPTVDNFGKGPVVATVINYDQRKPKPVAIDNNLPSQAIKAELSLGQGSVGNEMSFTEEQIEVVGDQELDDSLELVRDSLDEKDADDMERQNEENYMKENVSVTWTIGPHELKDSFEKYTRRASENNTRELLTDSAPPSGVLREKGDEVLDRGPIKGIKGEPTQTKPGWMKSDFPVTSGFEFYQPTHSSAPSALVTVPHFDHHCTNLYNTLQTPFQGTFHQNFPYPFYTSVGDRLVRMHETGQEEQEMDSQPLPLTGRGKPHEDKQVTESQGATSKIMVSPELEDQGHSFNGKGFDIAGPLEGETTGSKKKKTNNNVSRPKHSASPSSNASTSSSPKSTRSLIPRPPATKKTARGRVHPSSFHRKQTTVNSRKGLYNNSAVSSRGQSVKISKIANNNQMDRRSSSPPHSELGRNRPKRPESGDKEREDFDGIIEGIKRNMEMMTMRARHTAAEEQHQRIINSLKVDFSDDKRNFSSRLSSTAIDGSNPEDEVVANHASKQEAISRRVHRPRVGSAGSRAGRSPADGNVNVVARGEEGFQKGLKVNNDSYHHVSGSRPGRHPAGVTGAVTAHGIDSQSAGSYTMRPVEDNTGMELLSDTDHQLIASGGSRPNNAPERGSVSNGYYQVAFDGYPNKIKATSQVTDSSKNPLHAPGINQRFSVDKRRQEYATSTSGHPISAATVIQEREEFFQANGMNSNESENDDCSKFASLDKTPTDDEINHLWAHVRSYLHGGSTKSVGSDSCVNQVDVRRSSTCPSSMQQEFHQNNPPPQNVTNSQTMHGKRILGVPAQGAGSTLGGLRRYGSHEVLRRDSSSDSLSAKRSPLLQHRVSRSRRLQKNAHGQNGRPPLPRQHEYNPVACQTGPSASMSTRVGSSQPLSPVEMQAVMKASEKAMLHKQQDNFSETSSHQPHQAVMAGRIGPSAISLEEQRLLQSLDRLNERLRAQEEVTKAISQKSRMTDAGGRKRGQGSSQTRQGKNKAYTSNNKLLHTR